MKNKEIEKYKLELKEVSLDNEREHQQICCTSCGSSVPAEHINIQDKIAKCNHCNVVFSIQEAISKLIKKEKRKQEVLRPEGIDIFYFQNDLDISIQQPLTFLELLGILLLPFWTFILTALFWKGKMTIIVPAILLALSLLLVVNLIFRSRHKVQLSIGEKFLSIKWRPKKFHKDQFYPIQDIDQIYCKMLNGQAAIYMIVNGAKGQKHVKLLSKINGLSKAQYLEQEIEWHLGIEDREVPEESA